MFRWVIEQQLARGRRPGVEGKRGSSLEVSGQHLDQGSQGARNRLSHLPARRSPVSDCTRNSQEVWFPITDPKG